MLTRDEIFQQVHNDIYPDDIWFPTYGFIFLYAIYIIVFEYIIFKCAITSVRKDKTSYIMNDNGYKFDIMIAHPLYIRRFIDEAFNIRYNDHNDLIDIILDYYFDIADETNMNKIYYKDFDQRAYEHLRSRENYLLSHMAYSHSHNFIKNLFDPNESFTLIDFLIYSRYLKIKKAQSYIYHGIMILSIIGIIIQTICDIIIDDELGIILVIEKLIVRSVNIAMILTVQKSVYIQKYNFNCTILFRIFTDKCKLKISQYLDIAGTKCENYCETCLPILLFILGILAIGLLVIFLFWVPIVIPVVLYLDALTFILLRSMSRILLTIVGQFPQTSFPSYDINKRMKHNKRKINNVVNIDNVVTIQIHSIDKISNHKIDKIDYYPTRPMMGKIIYILIVDLIPRFRVFFLFAIIVSHTICLFHTINFYFGEQITFNEMWIDTIKHDFFARFNLFPHFKSYIWFYYTILI